MQAMQTLGIGEPTPLPARIWESIANGFCSNPSAPYGPRSSGAAGGSKLTEREIEEIQRCTRDAATLCWPGGTAE